MIAVTFALPQESRHFRAKLDDARTTRGGALPRVTGRMGESEVAVVHTGIGPASAARELEDFLRTTRPEMLITAGFAGALRAGLEVGDVFLAGNCSSPELVARIAGDLPRRTLTSQPELAGTAEAKQHLANTTAADAVDMESEGIARACAAHGIPVLCIRAISDAANESFAVPFPVTFDSRTQKPRPMALVFWLARHPGRICAFVRFVRGISKASRNLAEALERAVREI